MINIDTPIKKRSEAIDMVKGLSIMTLFYLHFENGWMDTTYNIFLVRSPVFYMVVGWLWGMSAHKRTVQQHWEKRKQGLVKPYLWFSLILLSFDIIMVILNLFESTIFWRDLYKTLCLRGIGTLWFLPALLGGEILYLYLQDKSKYLKILAYGITSCIICYYNWWHITQFSNERMSDILNAPFRVIKDVSDCFIFLSIAYAISSHIGRILLSQTKLKMFIEGAVLLIADFYLMNYVHSSIVINELAFIVGNVLGGIGILLFFSAIENIKTIQMPLSHCGKNSLIIMATHFGILLQLAFVFDKFIMKHATYSGAYTLIYFAIAVILQALIIRLINSKFKFIIGK